MRDMSLERGHGLEKGFQAPFPRQPLPRRLGWENPRSLTQTFLRMPKLGQLNPSLRGCLIKQPRKLSKQKIPPTGNPALHISCKEP